MTMTKKRPHIFYIFLLLLFPFIKPQLADSYDITRYAYYALKIISSIVIIFCYFKNNIKLNKYLFLVILFRLITLISSIYTESPDFVSYIGIILFDITFVMLIQYGMTKNTKQFLKAAIIILDFLIVLNFITLIIPGLHFEIYEFSGALSYESILGIDNRYIYYFLPLLFLRLVYSNLYRDKKLSLSDYIMYFVCLATLIYTRAVAALVAVLLFIPFSVLIKLKLKLKFFNYKFILFTFLVLNILLVFGRIQNYFEWLIVDILHKDLTLSYRTFIWDHCIQAISKKPFLGFGYQHVEAVMKNLNDANHAHNYMLMLLYRGGLLGFLFYCLILLYPNRILKKYKYTKNYYVCSFVIALSLLLCLFDSFDFTFFYLIIYGCCFCFKDSKKLSTFENKQLKMEEGEI